VLAAPLLAEERILGGLGGLVLARKSTGDFAVETVIPSVPVRNLINLTFAILRRVVRGMDLRLCLLFTPSALSALTFGRPDR
jgi:hypothetical protein